MRTKLVDVSSGLLTFASHDLSKMDEQDLCLVIGLLRVELLSFRKDAKVGGVEDPLFNGLPQAPSATFWRLAVTV